MAVLKARTEFASALNQVCAERGIEPEIVLKTIEEAIVAAYRRDFGLKEDYEYEYGIPFIEIFDFSRAFYAEDRSRDQSQYPV